jgi:hypothetical protein
MPAVATVSTIEIRVGDFREIHHRRCRGGHRGGWGDVEVV